MASSKQLRERAARFLAMAQHQGDTAPAELLTVKAAKLQDEAASAEASDAPPPRLMARQQNVRNSNRCSPRKGRRWTANCCARAVARLRFLLCNYLTPRDNAHSRGTRATVRSLASPNVDQTGEHRARAGSLSA